MSVLVQELRRHAVFHRVEVDRIEERAALDVDLVHDARIRVVEVLCQPVAGGNVTNQLAGTQKVAPEVGGTERARKQRADTDNRDPICLRSDAHHRPLRWSRG